MSNFERSKLPDEAQPIKYDKIKISPKPADSNQILEIHTNPCADELDSYIFESRNPFFADKAEALLNARFPEQETGIKIDLLLLKSASDKIDHGLDLEPEAYPKPWVFLMDELEFKNMMAYLDHLTQIDQADAAVIKHKILDFKDLTKEESEVLQGYLLDRERYLKMK